MDNLKKHDKFTFGIFFTSKKLRNNFALSKGKPNFILRIYSVVYFLLQVQYLLLWHISQWPPSVSSSFHCCHIYSRQGRTVVLWTRPELWRQFFPPISRVVPLACTYQWVFPWRIFIHIHVKSKYTLINSNETR